MHISSQPAGPTGTISLRGGPPNQRAQRRLWSLETKNAPRPMGAPERLFCNLQGWRGRTLGLPQPAVAKLVSWLDSIIAWLGSPSHPERRVTRWANVAQYADLIVGRGEPIVCSPSIITFFEATGSGYIWQEIRFAFETKLETERVCEDADSWTGSYPGCDDEEPSHTDSLRGPIFFCCRIVYRVRQLVGKSNMHMWYGIPRISATPLCVLHPYASSRVAHL